MIWIFGSRNRSKDRGQKPTGSAGGADTAAAQVRGQNVLTGNG
jgi:hypothetical protein